MIFSENDSIEKLNLSTRANNVLKNNNILTIQSFTKFPREDFISMRNLGAKTLMEILECLKLINEEEYKIVDATELPQSKKKEFVNFDGVKYIDVNVKDMDLSVRSFNCLIKAKYFWFSEIASLKKDDLRLIRNMGEKSIDEIIHIVGSFSLEKSEKKNKEGEDSEILCNLVFKNLSEFMTINGSEHYKNIIDICLSYANFNSIDLNKSLADVALLHKLYSNDYIKKEYTAYILEVIQGYIYGCNNSEILKMTPDILKDKNFVNSSIKHLINEGKVKCIDDNIYMAVRDSFVDGLKNILKEKEYDVFIKRTQNLTLEQIALEMGVTRERVRQIESKAIDRMNKCKKVFKEDVYKNIFNMYEITEKEFNIAFKDIQTYYYLITRYGQTKEKKKKIKSPLIKALSDDSIPEKMRKSIEKAVYRNHIKIGTEYIPCTRPEITNYVLKTFATNDLSFEDFTTLYLTIIEDIGKKDDRKLSVMDRGYENRLAASDTVLWKQGKRLRYYNMKSYDFDNLFETLKLEQYGNVEYSTRKFFDQYPEVMKDYDIRDEYELHNLLKKLCVDRDIKDINFARMPNIEFGQIDRNEQVRNLLLALAPISNTDFAKAYENEYGVNSATVLANYMKEFDKYFHDGIYKIDAPMLPNEVAECMKESLCNDFYLLDIVKNIFNLLFPTMDSSLINPFSIKALGFKVYSSYIINDRFSSATEFFDEILLKNQVVNLNDISPDIRNLQQFSVQLYKLKSDYSIIEFMPNRYITYEHLAKNGVTIDKILEFNESVYNFAGQNKYFTMHSLIGDGFSSELDEYGFENCFYSSLLVEQKKRISYSKIGNNKLFILGETRVLFEEFIENIIFSQPNLSMDIYDLNELLSSYYNINVSIYKLIETTKSTSMYYDAISEKIYAEYDIYYEEI